MFFDQVSSLMARGPSGKDKSTGTGRKGGLLLCFFVSIACYLVIHQLSPSDKARKDMYEAEADLQGLIGGADDMTSHCEGDACLVEEEAKAAEVAAAATKRRARRRAHLQLQADEPAKDLAAKINAFGRELCAELELASDGHPACALFEGEAAADTEQTKSSWAARLEAEQEHMQARMDAADSSWAQRALARSTMADSEDPATGAKPGTSHQVESSGEATEQSIEDEIESFGRELCQDPARQGYAACAQFQAEQDDHMTAWAKELEADQARMQARMDERAAARRKQRAERAVRTDPRAAALAARRQAAAELYEDSQQIKKEHAAWEKEFQSSADAYMQELCAHPERQGYPACAKFQNVEEEKGPKHDLLAEINEFGEELCSDPMREDYSACANFKDGEPSRDLNWSAVAAWSDSRESGTDSPMTFDRVTLREARWAAKIPKVACITVIPSTESATAYLQYGLKKFIENFRSQRYEGPKELVLVYDANNVEVSRLVQQYADGSFVRAAAFQLSGAPELPLAAAFRFGVLKAADADAIARWDLDAWHHAERLSMQVRALALGERPACLLESTQLLEEGAEFASTVTAGHTLLVGDAQWMRKEVRGWDTFEEPQARHTVRLDMPELSVRHINLMDDDA